MFCIGDFEFDLIELGLMLTLFCFVVQLLLCRRVQNRHLRRIPLGLVAVTLVLAGLYATGLFGQDGGGWIGNMHLLSAAILAIAAAFEAVGVGCAWGMHFLWRNRN